jgi:hypothetical protein
MRLFTSGRPLNHDGPDRGMRPPGEGSRVSTGNGLVFSVLAGVGVRGPLPQTVRGPADLLGLGNLGPAYSGAVRIALARCLSKCVASAGFSLCSTLA